MKKYLVFALLIGAIPAMAFGQVSVECDDCSHEVSVYRGSGGFIATADGADMVTWVASCDGVTRSGELEPNDDGVVSMLFDMDLACDDADGYLELGPVKDGGWYWLTRETSSAVGNLVPNDIEDWDNEAVDPTDAGDGVMETPGKGAVMLEESATGRVGILPTILPMPEMEPEAVTPCTGAAMNCWLGDGGTMIAAMGPVDPYTGMGSPLMNGDTVIRPAGMAQVTATFDLRGNGSGHFSNGSDATLGQPDGKPLTASFTAKTGASGPNEGVSLDHTARAGLTFATKDHVATLTVAKDSMYCNPGTANHSVSVTVTADATEPDEVTPSIAENATGDVAATFMLTVVCPGASANQGQELVPDNPFPTD